MWWPGALLLILLLEACRRTTGWVLPVFSLLFIAYAYYGGYLPYTWSLAHQGFNFDAIIAQFTMGTAGFYGTPLSVAASYIVLFTIYGAVLDYSGAGKFFIDLSFAAFKRSRTAPGRTVTLAGFLLGSVSGSGTATAVSLGTVSWPILRRAGYPAEPAGGMLAASGIGAILSPPTLGAAAFIIAEFLQVSLPDRPRVRRDPDDPVLPGHPARDRDRRPPARDHVGRDLRRSRRCGCCCGSGTTSSRCS